MLAGVGPVPAVLFVVAADERWMPQSAEHLLPWTRSASGTALLAVTRSDLADPGRRRRGRAAPRADVAGRAPAVAGQRRDRRRGCDRCGAGWTTGRRPARRPTRPATCGCGWTGRSRWRGAGTVVTGTLPAAAPGRRRARPALGGRRARSSSAGCSRWAQAGDDGRRGGPRRAQPARHASRRGAARGRPGDPGHRDPHRAGRRRVHRRRARPGHPGPPRAVPGAPRLRPGDRLGTPAGRRHRAAAARPPAARAPRRPPAAA